MSQQAQNVLTILLKQCHSVEIQYWNTILNKKMFHILFSLQKHCNIIVTMLQYGAFHNVVTTFWGVHCYVATN